MEKYKFKSLDLSEKGIEDISNLLKISSLNRVNKTPQLLNWQYNLNPLGKAIGYNAYIDQPLVAHYVNQPILATIDGGQVKGLLSFNIATHPNHRKKGLFIKLANLTYQLAKSQGYKFVIGVANENSIHGLTNKLGHQIIKPLDIRVGIGKLNISYNTNDAHYERYWNHDLLDWRLSNPNREYELKSYDEYNLIFSPMGKIGLKAIVGCFPKSISLPEMESSKTTSLNPMIWAGIDNNINWKNSLYLELPNFLRPSPMILHYKGLDQYFNKIYTKRVKFRGIDFDVF